jgi:hypothetical protein
MAEPSSVPQIRTDLAQWGVVTKVLSATQFVAAGLAGLGDGALEGYTSYVLAKHDGTITPPHGELSAVSAYISKTGTITHVAYTVPLVVGDQVLLLFYNISTAFGASPSIQEVTIFPVAEDVGTDEIADDGTTPPYGPAVVPGTSNSEATPDVVWERYIDFEQTGIITVISIYLELYWQSQLTVGGGGDATLCSTKMQISRDGGANWVDITDNFDHGNAAMTPRVRIGVGRWLPTIVAGANQLGLRLVSWTNDTVGGPGTSSCEAQIRSDSLINIAYRKS